VGRLKGHEFQVGNLNGDAGDSLKINVDNGRWKDFSSSEQGGRDLISLYAKIRNVSYRDAASELAEQFRIEKPKRLKLATSA
jgi:hypothetical protein